MDQNLSMEYSADESLGKILPIGFNPTNQTTHRRKILKDSNPPNSCENPLNQRGPKARCHQINSSCFLVKASGNAEGLPVSAS